MTYSFSDPNPNPGIYSYRLKQVDFDGTFEYSGEVNVEIFSPKEFVLHQNYPNPFNPITKITFSLASDAMVNLRVFDALGQEVMALINQELAEGVHTYNLDAAGFK